MLLAIQNAFPQATKNVKFNPYLLIYIPMNTVKNLTIIHLHLNKIDVLESVTLLMTYLITHSFQIKQNI